MTLKEQVYSAIQNKDFPDLRFVYSPEVLSLAPEVLEELLEVEKQDFYGKLETPDGEISFDTFEDFSLLDYFFSLLEHYQGVHSDDMIRKIIEDFEPKYIDFGNEIAYSKRYYEMLKICLKKLQTPPHPASPKLGKEKLQEQIRILKKSIESYEVR
jgi:Zn-dependent oligopeptidase